MDFFGLENNTAIELPGLKAPPSGVADPGIPMHGGHTAHPQGFTEFSDIPLLLMRLSKI
jgi:hypothetical protein